MNNNSYTDYTPEEILEIFKEQHRLCSPLDPMADETFDLKKDTLIVDWSDAQDLVTWDDLGSFFNTLFKTEITKSEWKDTMLPDDKKTIWDVCLLISKNAKKEIINPVKILGSDCLSAAIFLTLKANLLKRGVDVSDISPSSNFIPYLENYFSPMIEEIILKGSNILPEIRYKEIWTKRVFTNFLSKIFPKYQTGCILETGEIITFRDLVEKIIKTRANNTFTPSGL